MWNLWERTGKTGPSKLRTDITFSSLADPPVSLFLSHILVWQHSKETSWISCSSLYNPKLLLCSGLYSGMCTHTWNMDASPRRRAWETLQESYSAPPQVASEEKRKSDKGLHGEELDISLGCHQVYPWCISTPFQWEGQVWQVMDRLSPTREAKFQCKVCLYPHL